MTKEGEELLAGIFRKEFDRCHTVQANKVAALTKALAIKLGSVALLNTYGIMVNDLHLEGEQLNTYNYINK